MDEFETIFKENNVSEMYISDMGIATVFYDDSQVFERKSSYFFLEYKQMGG